MQQCYNQRSVPVRGICAAADLPASAYNYTRYDER